MFSFDALLPKLFVTSKATLLVGDDRFGLYVGRKVNSIFERKDRTIKISPNPSREYIKLTAIGVNPRVNPWVDADVDAIKIYHLLGECVLPKGEGRGTHPLIPSQERKTRIDLSGLAPGLNFIQIGNHTEKFVVVR